MRNFIIFLGCFVAFWGSIVALLTTESAYRYDLRGYVHAPTDYPLPYRVPRLGVNAELTQYDSDDLAYHLGLMQEAHIRWVRQEARWHEIERIQGEFDWQTWDNLVEAVEVHGLDMVVAFVGSPAWARPEGYLPTSPPVDEAHFGDFVRAFTIRYGARIDYYQIWDEPNLKEGWGGIAPNPHHYMSLLEVGYHAIKSHDADATVLMAGLAPTTEQRGDNISDLRYLEDLYALGAHHYWDAVVGKPYGFYDSPLVRDVGEDRLNFSRIVAMRELMVRHGEGHKPLWSSHWGWNSLPETWEGDRSIWGEVTASERVFYTLDGLTRVRDEWAWMGGMMLMHWQPDVPHDDARWGFAVIDQDDQPTELWYALASYDFDAVASNGLYHPRNDFTSYSGVWTLGELGADIGWLESSDSQFVFNFTGRDVSLLLREGDYFAFLYPQVNHGAANATSRDNSGNSYIFLRSASDEPEINLVPVARNLDYDEHRLSVTADRGWDRWALAGFAVGSEDQREPYERQMMWAWFSLVLSLTASVITAWRVDWGRIGFNNGLRLSIYWQYGVSFMTSLALLMSLLLTFHDGTPHIVRREASQYGIAIILSGGLVALTLPAILVMIASVLLFILIYNRMRIGIHLVLLYAPFVLFPVELYEFAFPMAEYLLLITFGAGILHWFANWGEARQTMPLSMRSGWANRMMQVSMWDWLVIAWVGIGFLAMSWSNYRGVALTELRTLFIEPGLFYALVRYFVRDVTSFKQAAVFLVMGGFLASVISLIQGLGGESLITAEEGTLRLGGIYGSPNNLALYVSRILTFVLAYVLLGMDGRVRWLSGFVVLLMMIVTLWTQSIGAIVLGIPLGVMVMLSLVYGRKALGLFVILAGLGSVSLILLSQISARFAHLFDLNVGTTFLRLRVWESTGAILRDYPLTGLGLDQFLYVYRAAYIRPDAIWDADLAHPHNIMLDHWVRLGIAGVILFLVIQWQLWRTLGYLWQRVADEDRWFVLGMIGFFAGLLGHGLVDNALFYPDLMLLVMFLWGIIANWQRLVREDDAIDKSG